MISFCVCKIQNKEMACGVKESLNINRNNGWLVEYGK